MQNGFYTMDDLANETAPSVAYDENPCAETFGGQAGQSPPEQTASEKIAKDMLGAKDDDISERTMARVIANIITDFKARGANGVLLPTPEGSVLIAMLPSDVAPSTVIEALRNLSNGDGNGEGAVLNVVDNLLEDIELSVLSVADDVQSGVIIERLLNVNEDSDEQVRVVCTISRRRRKG